LYRHISQDVWPWNVKFSSDATEEAFIACEVIEGKDARTLASEILAMSQEEFSAAFRKSPVKRAKLAGLQRNAAVVLENTSDAGDVEASSHRGRSEDGLRTGFTTAVGER
jgi:epoxyqueuosine reductase